MATDPREALAVKLCLAGLLPDHTDEALDAIRAWALEPEQIERAALGATVDPKLSPRKKAILRGRMHSALLALFGGDDGK